MKKILLISMITYFPFAALAGPLDGQSVCTQIKGPAKLTISKKSYRTGIFLDVILDDGHENISLVGGANFDDFDKDGIYKLKDELGNLAYLSFKLQAQKFPYKPSCGRGACNFDSQFESNENIASLQYLGKQTSYICQ